MSDIHRGRRPWRLAVVCVLVAGHAPGAQDRAVQTPLGQPERIRVGVALVTTSATVRDSRGRFLADLKPDEFELYEDGVRQTVVTFSLSHGGRVLDVARPTEGTREGLVLPPSRPPNDASGRIFLIFIDDQHLEPSQTPRVRELFNRITKRLIDSGDSFCIISTGPSSIEVDPTYDRKRLEQAASKIMGNGLSPRDVLDRAGGSAGLSEVRHRAHVAFSTVYGLLENMSRSTIAARRSSMSATVRPRPVRGCSRETGEGARRRIREQPVSSAVDVLGRGSGVAVVGAHALGGARQRGHLHNRSARPDRRAGH